MKALTFGLAGISLIASTTAFAQLHCEKQVNSFLELYSQNARTQPLSAPVNASDFSKPRVVAAPAAATLGNSYTTRGFPAKIEITGASSADMKKPVLIKVSAYHLSPGQPAKKPFTELLPDVEVRLDASCKLEWFVTHDFEVEGQKYTNLPIKTTAGECLKIFSLSASPNAQIWSQVQNGRKVSAPTADRIVANCRHNSNASTDPRISVPVMARLSGNAEELSKLFPPRQSKECANCKPVYQAF